MKTLTLSILLAVLSFSGCTSLQLAEAEDFCNEHAADFGGWGKCYEVKSAEVHQRMALVQKNWSESMNASARAMAEQERVRTRCTTTFYAGEASTDCR